MWHYRGLLRQVERYSRLLTNGDLFDYYCSLVLRGSFSLTCSMCFPCTFWELLSFSSLHLEPNTQPDCFCLLVFCFAPRHCIGEICILPSIILRERKYGAHDNVIIAEFHHLSFGRFREHGSVNKILFKRISPWRMMKSAMQLTTAISSRRQKEWVIRLGISMWCWILDTV